MSSEAGTHIIGDPSKMRVQLSHEQNQWVLGLKLTDQMTGDAMMANITADMAMQLGETMFKLGADLRAQRDASQT